MKNTREHAERLAALLRKLRRDCNNPVPFPPLNPVERIVHSFLLWECRRDKADAAYKHIVERVVDFNELRVCLVDEIVQVIGERYPLARERSDRLRRVLNDIYKSEFCVSLDEVLARGVRYTHSCVSALDGMVPFVSGQLILLNCNAHAVPVDDLLRQKLVKHGVVEKESTVSETRDWLERHIRAAESLETHLLFQQWVESDGAKSPEGSGTNGSTRPRSSRKKRKSGHETSSEDDRGD